jgi:Single-strand binding protein family
MSTRRQWRDFVRLNPEFTWLAKQQGLGEFRPPALSRERALALGTRVHLAEARENTPNFRLAVSQRVKDTDGSWRDGEASFFKVNVWRDQAENIAESLAKGNRAVVLGRLRTRSWETPEGDKRTSTEIDADEVAPA